MPGNYLGFVSGAVGEHWEKFLSLPFSHGWLEDSLMFWHLCCLWTPSHCCIHMCTLSEENEWDTH
jgi:hypothetical protein